jgi:hypothetical protein
MPSHESIAKARLLHDGCLVEAITNQETDTMQITGMLHGARLLEFAGFPTTEVLGPAASEEEIKAMIDKYGLIFIKPVFKGGIGKKGKAGLLGRAKDLQTALAEKERCTSPSTRSATSRPRPTA